ncbi:lysophospholipid acyltransferase family protein [Dehalogenimonas sp. 4OHTPN]|uniref:Lysophospholipid acyltransferase family protein n=1 Tax=Dehalogenimonas sp. 4OHTPN TaxID=3166643 RepID=A0AAU8G902_9CHLR
MKTAWFYPLVRLTARTAFLLTRVKVTGREYFPKTGPVIVCANHINSADPPLLGLQVPRNPVFFLAKKELFHNKFFGRVLRGSGAIPLNRAGVSGGSIKLARQVLDHGGALIIFPEGKRNPDGRLSSAQPGAAYLAASFGVPIVPAAITGTETVSGRWWFLKTRTVTIAFGRSFRLTEADVQIEKDDLGGHGDRIMEAVAELLPPSYRGVYGNVRQ